VDTPAVVAYAVNVCLVTRRWAFCTVLIGSRILIGGVRHIIYATQTRDGTAVTDAMHFLRAASIVVEIPMLGLTVDNPRRKRRTLK
jgi:hypothetical protein